MIKQVLNQIDITVCAEISLLVFAAVFVCVSIRTMFSNRGAALRHANIALDDLSEAGHDE